MPGEAASSGGAGGARGGQAGPAPKAGDRARLAAEALDLAKQDARARGDEPPSGERAAERLARGGPPARSRSPRRARRDDPQPLSAAIDGLLDEHGWRASVTAGSVFGRWEEIVGADLAAHTSPAGLEDGELTVAADSTAWATQVRLLASALARRLNVELGPGAVRRVRVRGPAGPARQRGGWRVRGSRGPGDTYG